MGFCRVRVESLSASQHLQPAHNRVSTLPCLYVQVSLRASVQRSLPTCRPHQESDSSPSGNDAVVDSTPAHRDSQHLHVGHCGAIYACVSWGSTGLMAESNKRQASATSCCYPTARRCAASGCTGSEVRARCTANQRVVTITICQAYRRAPLVLWLVLLAASPSSAAVWVSTDGSDTTSCGSSLKEACRTMESAIEQ